MSAGDKTEGIPTGKRVHLHADVPGRNLESGTPGQLCGLSWEFANDDYTSYLNYATCAVCIQTLMSACSRRLDELAAQKP